MAESLSVLVLSDVDRVVARLVEVGRFGDAERLRMFKREFLEPD